MLSVASVAVRLNVSRHTVYRLIHTGVLPAVKMHGALFVPDDALDSYVPEDQRPVRLNELPSAPRFLTATETAGVLRCSVRSVHRLIKRGDLAASRNPGRNSTFRIYSVSVQDYLDRQRVPVAS